jgi:hypothetical protein
MSHAASVDEPDRRVLSVDGTRLCLGGTPFRFRGLSFFNALFNPVFNREDVVRRAWVTKFWDNGVTALRVWCQWDFTEPHIFADVAPEQSLFRLTGELRPQFADRLCQLAAATSDQGMALEVTLFSHERNPNLAVGSLARGATEVSHLLLPYRNVLVQIWNENNEGTERFYELVKSVDPERLVTNSPGFSDDLGDEHHNRLMDVLTPHTVRQPPAQFWVDGPRQVGELVESYGKPVVDDEPARCGLVKFGGIVGGTTPAQHVAHLRATEAAGGYYTYHHDMFQSGYGDPATPAHGIPDPDFSSFHREVFHTLGADSRGFD